MERKKIVSSNINSIGYDEESKTLEVEFYDQKVYQYSPVSREGYNLLMNADSIGSFFAKNIRNNKEITSKKVTTIKDK